MNQPMMPQRREAWPIEDLLKGTDDLLDLDAMTEQIGKLSGSDYKPSDAVAKVFYAIFMGQREAMEWLLDLTLRAPYPHVSGSIEQAAIAAAKHQARAGIGEVIVAAIAEGKRLQDHDQQKKDQ